ncbi:MAG TPA: ribonuclease III [Lachnospiraceae bacterium]|nr:ribonuclease III [Lachnospiraceae bacterium]
MVKISKLKELEKRCGHRFSDISWLEMALRHSSYTNEHRMNRLECNERLEFLGDAVLELVSSEYLYQNYPDIPEGGLTKMRASLVCEPTLAYDAKALDLGDYLLLGKGEDASGGRKRDSIVSDALESVIGAIFMDAGFQAAKEFVLRFILDDVENKQLFHDSKTILQEMVQKKGKNVITYRLLREEGPDHDKLFTVCAMMGENSIGSGKGHSKKAAEQQAAYNAICKINESRSH